LRQKKSSSIFLKFFSNNFKIFKNFKIFSENIFVQQKKTKNNFHSFQNFQK